MYVYVYGTLKKGYRNHILLDRAKFVQKATTNPLYRLYDCGPFPCLIKSEHGNTIHGEIYEVDQKTLERLDRLEGHPVLYQREEISLRDFSEPCIAYFYQDSVDDFVDCGEQWPAK